MDIFEMNESLGKIESMIMSIKALKNRDDYGISSSVDGILDNIKDELNLMFPTVKCVEALWTLNTDKQFFGIKVDPVIVPKDALNIFITNNPYEFSSYKIEFDNKIIDIGLDEEEIVALLMYEMYGIINSNATIDRVRGLVDLHVISNDVINLRNSVNYSQLITFGLKDTIFKVSSILFNHNEDNFLANKLIVGLELLSALRSTWKKIFDSTFGMGESVRSPKTIILKWVFMVYRDIEHNSGLLIETLKDSLSFTGSVLEKDEILRTIHALGKIRNNSTNNVNENHIAPINKVLYKAGLESIEEISLFKSLKQSGLKSIEDQYYEYNIRAKNCDTEEDAMFIIRGINSRLSILEDYIYNTPELTEGERKRWESLANKYRELRDSIVKKKIYNKRQYGIFVDYNQFDQLDNQ